MEELNQYHEAIAVLLARTFLGLLFLFQGIDAVFNVKIKYVISAYESSFARKGIPRFVTVFASYYTSLSELIGGVLLILGLFELYACILLGINLIIAAIGFGINTPMWDTKYVLPRLMLLIFLLLVPTSWNIFSLDNLFFN